MHKKEESFCEKNKSGAVKKSRKMEKIKYKEKRLRRRKKIKYKEKRLRRRKKIKNKMSGA
jgi:hypothetical protein